MLIIFTVNGFTSPPSTPIYTFMIFLRRSLEGDGETYTLIDLSNENFCAHIFTRFLIYLFLEREEGREKERERNVYVWLPLLSPLLETWPATQARALTGN